MGGCVTAEMGEIALSGLGTRVGQGPAPTRFCLCLLMRLNLWGLGNLSAVISTVHCSQSDSAHWDLAPQRRENCSGGAAPAMQCCKIMRFNLDVYMIYILLSLGHSRDMVSVWIAPSKFACTCLIQHRTRNDSRLCLSVSLTV